ncbi:threonine synthase [Hyaloraphidium curvatum]|nr:threonine synthase [Hyaloraphidium curvatum]
MKYRSTRGQSSGLSFEEAVLEGLSPDGGLYIPQDTLPRFALRDVLSWRSLPYHELAFKLVRPYVGADEMTDADLAALLQRSFATFSHGDVTPVVRLDKDPSLGDAAPKNNFYVLELFHGPTFAFKDVALQVLGNLFEFFLERKNAAAAGQANGHANGTSAEHTITVLGATSGDTGGAAIYGLRGKKFVKLFILHPKGRVSDVQEAQMTTVTDSNVFNVAVEGVFDDCQDVVKMCFSDPEFRARHRLGAINSINWARILAQTSYYYAAYFLLLKQLDVDVDAILASSASDEEIVAKLPKVVFSVPTGNFGDILAGYYAVRTGLPCVSKLLIATNENDILHRFLETGTYNKRVDGKSGQVEPARATLSPAMDILVSSNFERLLWYLERGDRSRSVDAPAGADGDAAAERASAAVLGHMKALNSTGGFSVSADVLERCRELFASRCVSNAETSDAIRRYYAASGGKYILDPHTAVGVVAAESYAAATKPPRDTHTVVLATAHPAKFPEAVLEAVENGVKYEDFAPAPMVQFLSMPRRCVTAWTKGGNKHEAEKVVRQVIEDELVGKDVFAQEYGQKA